MNKKNRKEKKSLRAIINSHSIFLEVLVKKAQNQRTKEIVRLMSSKNLSDDVIAEFVNLSLKQVRKIIKKE
jgi:hypothetical protein